MNAIRENKGLAAAAQAVLAASSELHDAVLTLEAAVAALMVFAVSKDGVGIERAHPAPAPIPATPSTTPTLAHRKKGSSVLSDADKERIRALVKEGKKQADIAAEYGVSQSTISFALHGRPKAVAPNLPATVAGLITQALRRAGEALDRPGIIEAINAHHEIEISPDSVRRTTNEMVAKGTLVLSTGNLYSLPG